ncbi:phosphotransferase [Calidifontibacter terrae]
MLRHPNALAALADAALPRLMPRSVADVPTRVTDKFQEAVVVGADDQQWTVRVSRTPAAAAAAEQADAFLALLAKRVPFAVPQTEARMMLADHNLVTLHPLLPGNPATWRNLRGGSTLARSVGEALAALHDVDPRIADEASIPVYDADSYRSRRLAVLDRAAGTGLVPSGLLTRWERALEEVTLWRFPTCITHGPLEARDVLVDDHVRAITGWENASVADPADDFAAIVALAPTEALDTVLEVYSAHRCEAPDNHLERRARLSAELQRITALLEAIGTGDDGLIDRRAAALRRLDEQTVDDTSLQPRPPTRNPSMADDSEHPARSEDPTAPAGLDDVDDVSDTPGGDAQPGHDSILDSNSLDPESTSELSSDDRCAEDLSTEEDEALRTDDTQEIPTARSPEDSRTQRED